MKKSLKKIAEDSKGKIRWNQDSPYILHMDIMAGKEKYALCFRMSEFDYHDDAYCVVEIYDQIRGRSSVTATDYGKKLRYDFCRRAIRKLADVTKVNFF